MVKENFSIKQLQKKRLNQLNYSYAIITPFQLGLVNVQNGTEESRRALSPHSNYTGDTFSVALPC